MACEAGNASIHPEHSVFELHFHYRLVKEEIEFWNKVSECYNWIEAINYRPNINICL